MSDETEKDIVFEPAATAPNGKPTNSLSALIDTTINGLITTDIIANDDSKKAIKTTIIPAPPKGKPTINAQSPIGAVTTPSKTDIQCLIVDRLLERIKPAKIMSQIVTNYGYTERHAYRLIAKAKTTIAAMTTPEIVEQRITAHLRARKNVLSECEHPRDKLEVLKDMARLEGLYEERVTIRDATADKVDTATLVSIAMGGTTQ